MLKLVIANRNYSSWSLRAWLFLRESGIEFEEIRLVMFTETWLEEISAYSPAGRVPVLIDGDIRVWDSVAIIQYLQEKYSKTIDWPSDEKARAHARSISAEMHSGFIAMRSELPQNIRRKDRLPAEEMSQRCQDQIARIIEIWTNCRTKNHDGGSWLYGNFSIADIMYAPVALRFRSYGVEVPAPASDFIATVESLPAIQEWCIESTNESESISFIDDLAPTNDTAMTIG